MLKNIKNTLKMSTKRIAAFCRFLLKMCNKHIKIQKIVESMVKKDVSFVTSKNLNDYETSSFRQRSQIYRRANR